MVAGTVTLQQEKIEFWTRKCFVCSQLWSFIVYTCNSAVGDFCRNFPFFSPKIHIWKFQTIFTRSALIRQLLVTYPPTHLAGLVFLGRAQICHLCVPSSFWHLRFCTIWLLPPLLSLSLVLVFCTCLTLCPLRTIPSIQRTTLLYTLLKYSNVHITLSHPSLTVTLSS